MSGRFRDKASHFTADGKPKQGWSTRKRARAAVRRMVKGTGAKYLREYQCTSCLLYHIGNIPEWMKAGEAGPPGRTMSEVNDGLDPDRRDGHVRG